MLGARLQSIYLSIHGYRTAGFVNNPFLTSYFNHDRGFDTWRDVIHWQEQTGGSNQVLESINSLAAKVSTRLSDGVLYRTLKRIYSGVISTAESVTGAMGTTDADVVDEALSWLDETEPDDSFFLWVHLMDAHHPYAYDESHREALGIGTEHIRNPPEEITPGTERHRAIIDSYDTGIRRADAQIGRLIDGVSDDTVILCTGDHGEEFGKHRSFHTASGYDSMAQVPLVISDGRDVDRVETPVSHVDIAPTLASCADVEPHGQWDGTDMVSIPLEVDRDVFVGIETPEYLTGAVVSPPWKFIYEGRDRSAGIETKELYDISNDPKESHNLAEKKKEISNKLESTWYQYLDDVLEERVQCQHSMWGPDDEITEFDPDTEVRSAESSLQDSEEEVAESIEEQLEYLGYK